MKSAQKPAPTLSLPSTSRGRNYEGGDRLSTKPVTGEVTVQYSPADPRDSLIEPQPVSILSILLTVGLGIVAISLFVLGAVQK
jgi:hypothetical protein